MRAKTWLQLHGGLAVVFAMLGALATIARSTSPGRDIAALSTALGRAAGAGQEIAGSDFRWEASGGIVADFVFGRPVLFLARATGEDPRDVWRARVRLSPEGNVLGVVGVRNITNTPLGDDHALIVSGTRAAFATRAYGQEQSVTVLDLSGEGVQNKTEGLADRVMAALTNVQRTGSLSGLGRVDVTLESPDPAASLSLTNAWLDVALSDGRAARLDLSSGELVSPVAGVRADASVHLPKRFSHWAVDTLRAIPWIGPAPIAWLEERALYSRDLFRRITFRSHGGATDIVAIPDPHALPLDRTEALAKDDDWPPTRIPTIWKSPEAGEGEWVVPDVPWLRTVPGVSSDAPAPFYRTYVRPDEERPYVKVLLVAMDARQVDVEMEAGVEDPEPLTGPHGVGHVPRDPAIYRRIAVAFNGAFKTEHGHYGMMVHKRVLLPPVPGSATVVVLRDGRVGFGNWGPERRIGGIDGVDDEAIVSYRQNLDPLIDGGRLNPTGRNVWGYTLPGKGVQTERSALCVTNGGHIVYAWGDDVSATTLAKSMKMAGCDYGMHLDMNPYHTGFLFTAIDDLAGKKYKSQLLTPAMSIPLDRYIQYAPKDFFYVMVHDWEPPQVQSRDPLRWIPSAGTQPPPRWMPGIWSVRMEGSAAVELVDVEAGRTTWRLRAGTEDAPAAAPLRELLGDQGSRALLAAGMGVALDKRPRGIATDGRLAVPVRGGSDSGALLIGDDGQMTFVRAQDARRIGPHTDMVELPIVLWDGIRSATPSGAVVPRTVIGVTPDGRILFARGTVSSMAPLADALVNAGCTRALALDRGAHATAFFDRAGTDSPPRVRYDETVVYAIASALTPRAFHFTASAPASQDAKPR